MRKNVVIQFALATAAILLLVGYQFFGSAGGELAKIRIATGGSSGIYFAYGNALADMLEKRMNVPVTAIQSGGSVDNIRLLKDGRAEIAFVQNDIMTYAYNGTNFFSTEGEFKDFSAIAGIYAETCQVVARREISSISDLNGRRVSVGDEGSGTELNAIQILGAYGMSYADIDVDHLSFGASVSAFRDGKIDAFFCTAGVPTPAISQLAAEGEAHILSVGDAHARSLISRYPFYAQQVIPNGAYPGIDGEAETVAVKATLVASNKLSDQAVHQILKTLFDGKGEISKIVPQGDDLNRDTALEGIPIPLHPGAEKYFFEK
ncbi:MAG: TAXI family TRAP transporter solute-binding subunit [Synergistaceae bacterium]|jgi:TRAP transporter TAXI family solute receptor|nr:TAXI family TRAP transporter solute-binding subunit [Synergistaceae bacterium]